MALVVAAAMLVALVLAVATADVARVLAAAAEAPTAADLAALAAARELAVPGDLEPSDVASAYADRNGAVLVACRCERGSFQAVVQVRVPVGPLLLFPDDRWVTGIARAVVELP